MSEPRSSGSATSGPTRTIADAKAHFAECVRQVESGASIVLTRHGRAVARLVPIDENAEPRPLLHGSTRQPDEVAEASTAPTAASPFSRAPGAQRQTLRSFLDDHIWPRVPPDLLGRGISKQEREEILGSDPPIGTSAPKAPVRERRP